MNSTAPPSLPARVRLTLPSAGDERLRTIDGTGWVLGDSGSGF
jgi:hypothetical protein